MEIGAKNASRVSANSHDLEDGPEAPCGEAYPRTNRLQKD